jgi:hypothetical protein
MKYKLSHGVDSSHYTADACVVWCFDDRFSKLLKQFIANKKFKHIDLVKVAGGAKDIASPTNETSRHFILDQIGKSVRLHAPTEVILMMHIDCGACDGKTEPEFYQRELKAAGNIVEKFLADNASDVSVTLLFADFSGIQSI